MAEMVLSIAACTPKCNVVVSIPVHNEEAMIERCLLGLAGQIVSRDFEVLLFLNNCVDRSRQAIEALAASLPFRVHLVSEELRPEHANAGHARRLAMQHAAGLVAKDGVLLTSDADSVAAPDWLAVNLAEIEAGADAVAGMALIDGRDVRVLPGRLLEEECGCAVLAELLDQIDWLIDPDLSDPWPRHTQHSGASIAVRAPVFVACGGIPPVPVSEDRMFFERLRRMDAKIRHSRDAVVTVSGRLAGRAVGGMADTLRRRLARPDVWLDEIVEPPENRVRRARARKMFRAVWGQKVTPGLAFGLARALRVAQDTMEGSLGLPYFGAAWAEIEASSPILRRRRIRTRHLQRAIAQARLWVAQQDAKPPMVVEAASGVPAMAAE
jgi:glycosyltransferase involved in cell wall biosynthesis